MVEATLGSGGEQDGTDADPILALLRAGVSASAGYRVLRANGPEGWITATHESSQMPGQGWKLHVSATRYSAQEALRRALAILVAERVTFKVAPLAMLDLLNSGGSGLSQVGKFLTVYPENDLQAVRLAAALDAATGGLRGPVVPSDRPLNPSGVVSYRYGGFDKRSLQDADGLILSAIEAPDGSIVPDLRLSTYIAPPWAIDPFVAAGVATDEPPNEPILAQRYLLTGLLAQSARGAVYLAIDLAEQRACVIKQARRNALVGADGDDARDRLRHESDMLLRLAGYADLPQYYGLFAYREDLFLAMEYVRGETLARHVRRLASAGRLLPFKTVLTWGGALATALAAIHAQGVVLCDLKASNVIISDRRRLCLIDLELAVDRHDSRTTSVFGTRGYASPQRCLGLPPSTSDDIYSFGAMLYFLVTAAEPSAAPQPESLLTRPLRALRPDLPPQLERIISACLDPDPEVRMPSATQLVEALARLQSMFRSRSVQHPPPPACDDPRQHYSSLARSLGDSLVTIVEASSADSRVASRRGVFQSSDVGTGLAGVVISLAGLASKFREARFCTALRSSAMAMLSVGPLLGGERLPGLYVGRAGVSLALLRAGQALSDTGLIEMALREAESIARLPHRSPDLFAGSAGRLRLHLQLWRATCENTQLDAAVASGAHLLACARERRPQELEWALPSGYGTSSGKALTGYAYGAAGIGDALLDLFAATGDDRLVDAACGAARWLARLARPAIASGRSLSWPTVEGGPISPSYWCHGASGIGRFFLSAAQCGCMPGAVDIAYGAALGAARGARWVGPSQCHGLAGNIEFLLDAARALGGEPWLTEAYRLAALLETFAFRQGGQLWPGDHPDQPEVGFLTGSAGILACLLRLGAPDHTPNLITVGVAQ